MINYSEWQETDWNEIQKECTILDTVDESECYEVDQALVGLRKSDGKFCFVMASGCSCWDGDAKVKWFDNLNDMENFLLNEIDEPKNQSNLYISINGAKQLIFKAKETFFQACVKLYVE